LHNKKPTLGEANWIVGNVEKKENFGSKSRKSIPTGSRGDKKKVPPWQLAARTGEKALGREGGVGGGHAHSHSPEEAMTQWTKRGRKVEDPEALEKEKKKRGGGVRSSRRGGEALALPIMKGGRKAQISEAPKLTAE